MSASSSSGAFIDGGTENLISGDEADAVIHPLIPPTTRAAAQSSRTPAATCKTSAKKRAPSTVHSTSRKIRKLSSSAFATVKKGDGGPQMGQALDLVAYSLAGPKPNSKSKVWEDFSLVKRKSDNKIFDNIAACNHCLIVVSHIDANTSSMIRHECKHESSKPMKLTQFPGVLQPVSLPEEHRRTLVDGCVKLSAAIPGIGFATHRSEAMLEFIQMIIDVTTKVGRPWDAAKSIPSDTTISRKCKEVAA
ncbi:hypothetical protein FOL46_002759, partial [Perkinsus olseni]